MAIWGDIFDTLGGKAIIETIEHVSNGEGGKAIEALTTGAVVQEFKDAVKDVAGAVYDKVTDSDS